MGGLSLLASRLGTGVQRFGVGADETFLRTALPSCWRTRCLGKRF